MDGNYWSKAFITSVQKFCLVDNSGDIRATSYNIDGIVEARKKYGWGNIHRMTFKRGILKIGEEII